MNATPQHGDRYGRLTVLGKFFQDESKALAYIAIQKAMGRRVESVRWRLGTIEVRTWVEAA